MKLSDLSRQVLVLSQLRADISYAELARMTGRKEHSIRRAASRIVESGHFIRKASLNLSSLGLHEYNIYLSFNPENLRTRKSILHSVANLPGVKWLDEVTSKYDTLLAVLASSFREVSGFLEEMNRKHGNFLLSKEVFGVVHVTFFGRRYLFPPAASGRSLRSEDCEPTLRIDDVDHQLLRAITDSSFDGVAKLSRRLKLPESTVRLRLGKLGEKGVIVGFTYNLVSLPEEIHAWRVLIFLRGGGEVAGRKLENLAQSDYRMVYIVQTLGAWDYELQYESLVSADILNLGPELVRVLGENLLRFEIIPVVAIRKGPRYPRVRSELER